MKRITHYPIVIVTLCILAMPGLVKSGFAGSSQAETELFFPPETVIGFAKKVEKSLAENRARVAILARVGRPRENLPEGIRFTHVSYAVYSQISVDDGRKVPGYAIYNLYQSSDDPDRSKLIQDYPVDFFAGVRVLEAGILIPTPEIQRRLLQVLASETYKKLHNPHYSAIANPFTLNLQNCTEHTLDLMFAAVYETDDLTVIKKNEAAYFKAQHVTVNPLKLWLGSLFISEIAISDHPGSPVTATFTTIGEFMEKYKLLSKKIIISETADLSSL